MTTGPLGKGAPLPYDAVKAPRKPKAVKRLKAISPKTGGSKYPNSENRPLREYVKTLPCILEGRVDRNGLKHHCQGPIDPCHLKPWGSSGEDDENLFPGCRWGAHHEQEGHTKEFEYHWALRLKPICRKVTAAFYDAKGGKVRHA